MSRVQLALAGLVLFCVGGLVGAAVVNKPPAPVATTSHVEQSAKLNEIGAHEARKDDTASVFRVLPEVKVTKRKTTYHPPAPQLPPFPGSPPVCNCPTTGAIASVEETTTETGKGSEAISAASSSSVASATAKASEAKATQDLATKPTQAPASRWTFNLGASTKLAEPTDKANLGLTGGLGLRLTDKHGVRLTGDLPLNGEARGSLMWEWRP